MEIEVDKMSSTEVLERTKAMVIHDNPGYGEFNHRGDMYCALACLLATMLASYQFYGNLERQIKTLEDVTYGGAL